MNILWARHTVNWGAVFIFTFGLCAIYANAPKPGHAFQQKAAKSLFNVNLIADGDAEADDHGVWKPADVLKTIVYGEFGGGPAADSPGPVKRGSKYFYASVTTANPRAIVEQKVDVSTIAKSIDEAKVGYSLAGYFGGVNTSHSSARLNLVFLDKDGKQLGADMTGEVKEQDRADDLVLVERKREGALPNGTRTIQVKLEFYLLPGHASEAIETLAYADNLALVLTQK